MNSIISQYIKRILKEFKIERDIEDAISYIIDNFKISFFKKILNEIKKEAFVIIQTKRKKKILIKGHWREIKVKTKRRIFIKSYYRKIKRKKRKIKGYWKEIEILVKKRIYIYPYYKYIYKTIKKKKWIFDKVVFVIWRVKWQATEIRTQNNFEGSYNSKILASKFTNLTSRDLYNLFYIEQKNIFNYLLFLSYYQTSITNIYINSIFLDLYFIEL